LATAVVGAPQSSSPGATFGFQNIIGDSAALREATALAARVATSRRTTVLLIGETGTGKELFSRGIHYASAAANEPFVAINCAAIPESLLESELFGHEKGAFTGAHARKQGLLELAASGTLFLDEVHQLPRQLQPKLLRALESRQVRRLGGLE
jgi:transcriptional regulator with PAS, ATPase and Fis domain